MPRDGQRTTPADPLAPEGEPPELNPTDSARTRTAFATVAAALGRPGVYRSPDVYVVTVRRNDLSLAVDGMPVPAAAGIESVFHFYFCPCGKTIVLGQVAAQDHELNDVIDALRAGKIEIISTAPMLLHARGAPLAVRLYAEGKPDEIGRTLREALRWTGKERMAPAGN
ncbi:MAG: hypothetical protein JWO31_2265 [Phycisphaerales bacterium]|nr:hypothetical protein [Phycisphaerales bacterium]